MATATKEETIGSLVLNIIVSSIFGGVFAFLYLTQPDRTILGTLFSFYAGFCLPYGWKSVNRIMSGWTFIATMDGWIKIFLWKLTATFALGLFITPFCVLWDIIKVLLHPGGSSRSIDNKGN